MILDAFLDYGFLRRALVGCLAVSVSAPVLGLFLMLRRMSLTADVLGHGILPGVAAGFLLAGLSVPVLAVGGVLAGLLVALGAGALSRVTGGREDASLAAMYLVALAAGVTMVSLRGGPAEVTQLLFGNAMGVDDAVLLLMAGTATLTLLALAFAWRPLVLECFDPAFAQAVGARGAWWHMGFLSLVVLNLLAGFQALGTLMAVGLMMLPAIAARHWARSVGGMAYAAVGIAVLSSCTGLALSVAADVPSGPAVVLCAGVVWAASVLCGPVDGLLGRLRRTHRAG